MNIISLLLSLFCMVVCAWSALLNYRSGNTMWMWVAIALTVWNGLTFASSAAAFIR